MPLSPIDLIYGPMTIGVFLNILLYGVMITQTYHYISTFKGDKLWMKCFVGIIFFADSLNTFFDATFIYKHLVANFGNTDAVLVADWIFDTDPGLTAIIACAVQFFFAWRIKVLTQNLVVTITIAVCSVVQLLSGLATSIACTIVTHFVDFQRFKAVVILWLAFSALADVLIAIAMTWHLRKKKTGFAFTDNLIDRITRLTVQTGAITAVFATIDLIAFLVSTSGLHLAFNFPLAKLYTNSLLSTLNARSVHGSSAAMNSSSHGIAAEIAGVNARVGTRKEEHDVDFSSHTYRNGPSKIHDEHELNDVSLGTKVYINVEEIRETV